MLRLFLPQATLEQWAAEGRADLKEGTLYVDSNKLPYRVAPAVHFAKLVSGADAKRLLATVKTAAQLDQMGAEQMLDSVIVGDDAYEIVPGYLAEVASTGASAGQNEVADEDLLAAFLLDKMT